MSSEEIHSVKKYLSPQENRLLCLIASLFSGYTSNNGILKGHSSSIAHAFGISKFKLKNIVNHFSDYDLTRKPRKDRGKTIFNCPLKRSLRFTAYNNFKKLKLAEFRETTEKIPEVILKAEYESLPDNDKYAHSIMAQCDLERAEFLWDELKDLLFKTKGKISYRCMSAQLGNIVSHNTVRLWIKRQGGFRIRKDRILPSLDPAAKARRIVFAHSFWLFWKSARLIPIEKAIMVLIHMDEKWFYAVRARSNTKVITSIGLEPNDYYVHHKNHIGKEMYICAKAFVLTQNNDITRGGVAVPISMIRVGKMTATKRDTYKRVYRTNGTYHYPKIQANKLRSKGDMYLSHWN